MQLLNKSPLAEHFSRHTTPEMRLITELLQRVKKLEGLVAGLREETLVLLEDEPIKRGG